MRLFKKLRNLFFWQQVVLVLRLIEENATLFVWGAALIYFTLVGTLSVADHYGLRTQYSDLGHMEQAIWQVTQGNFAMPISEPDPATPRFTHHANLIFYLLALPYLIFPSPLFLLLLGTGAIAVTSVLLYSLGRKLAGSKRVGLIIALAYLLNPLVQEANLFDFHPVVLAYPLFVAAVLLVEKKSWKLFAVCIFLILITKENLVPLVAALGFYVVFRKSREAGLVTILAAVLYWIFIRKFLTQIFEADFAALNWKRFQYLGNSPEESALTLITQPWLIWQKMQTEYIKDYLGYLTLLGGWIVIFCPLCLIWILPPLLENVVAAYEWQARLTDVYYSGIVITVIYTGAAFSFGWLIKRPRKVLNYCILLFFMPTLITSIVMSPLPYGARAMWEDFRINHNLNAFKEVKELIPKGAPLATQNNVAAHFADRQYIFKYPNHVDLSEYILIHVHDPNNEAVGELYYLETPVKNNVHRTREYQGKFVERVFFEQDFGVIFASEQWYLLKRGADTSLNTSSYLQALADLDRF